MKYSIYKSNIENDFIQSIKDLRSVFGYGLKETKDICDVMRYYQKPYIIEINEQTVSCLRNYGFTVSQVDFSLEEGLFTFVDISNKEKKEVMFVSGVLRIKTQEISILLKLDMEERRNLIKQLESDNG